MCGIVGAVGSELDLVSIFEGLRRLEYRGYDSAGIAVIHDGELLTARASVARESMDVLASWLAERPFRKGEVMLGHTRWPTHGAPTLANTHPHLDCHGDIAVVHNGIIENFRELRAALIERGHRFGSDTDSEVVAHLMEEALGEGLLPARALEHVFVQLRGHMALVVALRFEPRLLLGIRRTSPLLAAVGEGQAFFASDAPAFLSLAEQFYEVPEDVAVVLGNPIAGDQGLSVGDLEPLTVEWSSQDAVLDGFASYYEMELHQSAEALYDTVSALMDGNRAPVIDQLRIDAYELARVRKVVIIGCGTSYHAGLVGRYLVEHLARVPVEVDVASEYRYRDPILDADTLVIGISQSGESLETITALRDCQVNGARTIAITNVIGSQLSRVADGVLYTRAGPEISVASTKTHLAQIGALAMFAIYLGEIKGTLYPDEAKRRRQELAEMAPLIRTTVEREGIWRGVVEQYLLLDRFFFIGRNLLYPVAMEGALKMKELSYIAAEAYPAGELKHGPIAMLDEQAVVVALLGDDRLHDKMLSNLEEVRARGAKLIVVAPDGDQSADDLADAVLRVPPCLALHAPLLMVLPLQVLAGWMAKVRGLDLDKPRNLAKTVTVE
ncbi:MULTISPECIES: glutamine--fructose-6-phosphate transaminase (isomerizing) [Ferrimicrobium]|jgi:glucosamine--fructose-6-phosphate aminotransferase (isomerizing)|uniref:Glutamine--fructose-6-phosphate aminotransferase [isomerizing] n=1 Tax=Ferrimicrobium acidiphilum TaxID=121039 RepID=A0ABV3XYW9_9ACTN|nr:glutamine--fructose-6-phosphate transaminase (isomerizing) [Ferrimicrobium sp.]